MRIVILQHLFKLLYGPLIVFHEATGRIVFGPAWAGRRKYVLECIPDTGYLIDVGAGEGRLSVMAVREARSVIGFDPSLAMRSSAVRRGANILHGWAGCLPIPDATVDSIVATYPGPWIADSATWREFGRVLHRDGIVVVLLGGTVARGRFSRIRNVALWLIYGRGGSRANGFVEVARPFLAAQIRSCPDQWGTAFVLIASKNQHRD